MSNNHSITLKDPAILADRLLKNPQSGAISGKSLFINPENNIIDLLDTLNEGVIVCSPEGNVLRYNRAACQILNYDLSGIINIQDAVMAYTSILEPGVRFLLPNGREMNLLQSKIYKSLNARQTLKNEEIGIAVDKSPVIWVQVSLMPLIDEFYRVNRLIISFSNVTEYKKMRRESELYLKELTRIQEEERKRIARELHDDTAQSLACLAMELDAIVNDKEVVSEKLVNRLEKLKQQVEASLKGVRRFSHELRPGVLDQFGLIAALEMLIGEMHLRKQIEVTFNVYGDERRLSVDEELALFRIAQEALNNIRKHSGASRAAVNLRFSSRFVRLMVWDNGKGLTSSEMDQAAANGRLGLIGMRERARLIGGDLSIRSNPGKGVTVSVQIDTTSRCEKKTGG